MISPDTVNALFASVETIAEESFFASAEPCTPVALEALAAQFDRWLVSSVTFEEGPLSGSVMCTMPEPLAAALFDAFTGRDPADPEPRREHVLDLVGEFANMTCGTWLSRCAGDWTFKLHAPVVEAGPFRSDDDGLQLFVTINDRWPLVVAVRLH